MVTGDDALWAAVRTDWRTAALSERERVVLGHVEWLTLSPGTVTETHLDALRRVGLDDDGIVQVTSIAAIFAYLNRMADGLGVGRG